MGLMCSNVVYKDYEFFSRPFLIQAGSHPFSPSGEEPTGPQPRAAQTQSCFVPSMPLQLYLLDLSGGIEIHLEHWRLSWSSRWEAE